MRTLGEIAHPACKISMFSWNGKYLVKFEQGFCEQTYKFEHLELEESQLREHVVGTLVEPALKLFGEMHLSRNASLE